MATKGILESRGNSPRPFYLEGYLFVAAIYWTLCFGLSRYSRWLEGRLRTP